jgi:hypothetical protein
MRTCLRGRLTEEVPHTDVRIGVLVSFEEIDILLEGVVTFGAVHSVEFFPDLFSGRVHERITFTWHTILAIAGRVFFGVGKVLW